MKKVSLFLICLSLGNLQAQEIKSKKGENYLPEAKDCALQIDAVPFLNYTGKLLSNAGSTSPNVSAPVFSPFTIGGKYFKTNTFAYRAKARIGVNSSTVKNTVISNKNTNLDTVYTSDSKTIKESNFTFSFGFEKRRGKTRLQGYYGAEAMLIIGGGKTKYSYGNALDKDFTSVFTTNFDSPISGGYTNSLQSSRVSTIKNGTTIGLGARAFFGVEYFIFPKISLAAEFGWSMSYTNTNDGSITTQRWDVSKTSAINKTLPVSGNSHFGVDTDNTGGQLMLSFHF